MSKHYIGGTVRYGRVGALKPAPINTLENFKLCSGCNRYVPRRNYPEHVAVAHPKTVLHIPTCECGSQAYTVSAGELGGECGNVSACEYCERIATPLEYLQ